MLSATLTTKCKTCSASFIPKRGTTGNYCSRLCYWDSKTRKNSYKCTVCGGQTSAKKVSECWKCRNKTNSGEKHPNWKGALVEYRALHSWIQRKLGTPNMCESCGKTGSGHSMHWANISREYRRDLSDWMRLCPPCHKQYDNEARYQNI